MFCLLFFLMADSVSATVQKLRPVIFTAAWIFSGSTLGDFGELVLLSSACSRHRPASCLSVTATVAVRRLVVVLSLPLDEEPIF